MAARKSFFDRLTGGANFNELGTDSPMPRTATSATKKIIPSVEGTNTTNDDWVADSEAELTVDVYQTPTHLIIQSAVAGVKNEDLDIGVQNGVLTVRGRRGKDEETKEEDYYTREIYWGSFARSILLPDDLDLDRIDAKIKGGMLTVKIPKQDKRRVRKIVIKGND